MRPPTPTEHPNAYATFSVASAATLLVYEAKTRLGVDLTVEEAGFIVGALATAWLALGKRRARG